MPLQRDRTGPVSPGAFCGVEGGVGTLDQLLHREAMPDHTASNSNADGHMLDAIFSIEMLKRSRRHRPAYAVGNGLGLLTRDIQQQNSELFTAVPSRNRVCTA